MLQLLKLDSRLSLTVALACVDKEYTESTPGTACFLQCKQTLRVVTCSGNIHHTAKSCVH